MSGIYGSEYGETIIPGELGSTDLTASQDNSGNTIGFSSGVELANPATGNGAFLGEGIRSGIDSWDKAYTDAGGTLPARFGLNDLKQFAIDNKSWLAGAGALAGIYGGGTNADKKTGYQGVIPTLAASRSMIAAPPTRAQGYRPGAGGIDYGGDVTYALAPGMDPWANLSGTSGSAAGSNLSGTTTTPGATSGTSLVTTPGTTLRNTGILGSTTGGKTTTSSTANTSTASSLSSIPYFQKYPDVAVSYAKNNYGMTPEAYAKFHYENYGVNENRISPQVAEIAAAGAFGSGTKITPTYTPTAAAYFQKNPDVQREYEKNNYGLTPDEYIQTHYENYGINEKRDAPGVTTNAALIPYFEMYPDVAVSYDQNNYGLTPEQYAEAHYTNSGRNEQRISPQVAEIAVAGATGSGTTITPTYTPLASGYFEKYPDVAAEYEKNNYGLTPDQYAKAHYENYGIKEKREAPYAQGGEIAMAKGRYLQGQTDGMADELPAQIGGDQPAALSHGEFVIPADVVSHMGNGNSDAGAKKLYQMMDKIRMARTGTKKQGKKINPDKFMPGGLAQAYAAGGKVKKYAGETGSLVTADKNYSQGISGIESNLSNWAGPYVTNMLGQGQALANMPYQAYMGPLTSGESPLQTQAFNTAGSLTTPTGIGTAGTTAGSIATKAQGLSYTPTTSSFDTTQAQTYMNPYLQASLNPQLDEARRQSQITQQQNAAKMTQAGAFGGSRQAILDAETQRNLANTQANITGQGYSTAYDKAMAQFNADQARKMQEAQYGAGFGLQGLQTGLQAAQAQGALGAQESQVGLANLQQQLAAGQQQRGIESEGIAADKAQFEEARANPYKMVQYQQSLLQGLPLAAQSYQGIEPSALIKASQGATTVNALLKNLGLI